MKAATHLVIVYERATISYRVVEYDGERGPSLAQVRSACGISEGAQVSIVDLRVEKITSISATDGPDGLQHCTMWDLGAQLDMWTTNRFSAIYDVSTDLMNGKQPSAGWVGLACEELRDIEPEVGEVLDEEAAFAHAMAKELERRFCSMELAEH